MKGIIRVALKFTRLTNNKLVTFVETVEKGYYGQAISAKSPVPREIFSASRKRFTEAVVKAVSGGPADTAARNKCREELMLELREIANHVQGACGTLEVLLKCGFETISTSRTRTVIPKPSIIRIVNGMSGQLLVSGTPAPNGRNHQVEAADVDEMGRQGPFRQPVTHSSSRNVPVINLIPGKRYAFRFRTMGGLSGCSDWSDVMLHRAN